MANQKKLMLLCVCWWNIVICSRVPEEKQCVISEYSNSQSTQMGTLCKNRMVASQLYLSGINFNEALANQKRENLSCSRKQLSKNTPFYWWTILTGMASIPVKKKNNIVLYLCVKKKRWGNMWRITYCMWCMRHFKKKWKETNQKSQMVCTTISGAQKKGRISTCVWLKMEVDNDMHGCFKMSSLELKMCCYQIWG